MEHTIFRRGFLRTGFAGSAAVAAAAASGSALAADLYRPGTYSAKAPGIGGDVIVTMTFGKNKITDVVIDAGKETPGIGQAAAPMLKKLILAKQSAKIDVVTGASITSNAVVKAAAKCNAQAKGEIPVEQMTKTVAEEKKAGDWLGKAPKIADKDIKSTVTTDIVVVGGGSGGMFAVAAAAEAGGKVIGIDRYPVGTGIREDLGAIDSRYQKKWGTKIDKFEYIAMATQYAGGHLSQELVKLFCDESGATIDWLGDRYEERGVELWHESGDENDDTRYKHFPTGHSPRLPKDKNGQITMRLNEIVHDYAVKKGARFDHSTRMVKLEKNAKGRVTGLIAQNADGDYVAKKGVVVATGGYARDYDMIEALQPWNLRIVGTTSAMPGATGDGIRACLWVGAKMDETHSMMMFDRCAIHPNQIPGRETIESGENRIFWMASQPWLKVNQR